MKKLAFLLFLIGSAVPPVWAQKKRVAVMDFEYGTVQGGVSAIFGTNVDIGKGIADLLVDRLVRDGTYSVIERKALQKLLAEQNFSNSDRADSNSAAKIGKMLGVDAIIIGSITQFGRDDKNVGVGGGVMRSVRRQVWFGQCRREEFEGRGGDFGAHGAGGDGRNTYPSPAGKASPNGVERRCLAPVPARQTAAGGGVDMASTNFSNSIIGEATAAAVSALRTNRWPAASKLPERFVLVEGLIADVSGSTLIMNVGARAGVKVGQNLQVIQGGREIRDPATGESIAADRDADWIGYDYRGRWQSASATTTERKPRLATRLSRSRK